MYKPRILRFDAICVIVIAVIACCIITYFSIKNTADTSFEEPVIVKTEDNTIIYEYKENTVKPIFGGESLYSPYGLMEDNGQSQKSSGNDKHTGEVL